VIHFREVSKLYGSKTDTALKMLSDGCDSRLIREKTEVNIALYKISLSVSPRQIIVVMGLSGSGKSTLLRLVNGLIKPTVGKVSFFGKELSVLKNKDLRSLRRKEVSMVFQDYALLPHLTVSENIKFGLDIQGRSSVEKQLIVSEWIERIGLKDFEKFYPHELSGGMRQRVGLARALVTGASSLLMDEPFSALDPLTRKNMQNLLIGLQQELRKTIIFVTHDFSEALKLGDIVVILKDGKIIQKGTGKEIIDSPADDYVRSFISNDSFL